jgi:hypothetical protein
MVDLNLFYRMNPHVQMKDTDICKVTSNLLLTNTFNFLNVMKFCSIVARSAIASRIYWVGPLFKK